ncbi:MerR family transcriptional regulator [Actinomycetes bacterium KLBMP 9759]
MLKGPAGIKAPMGVSRLDDADYPAVTMGQAADLLQVQPAFLRSLDAAGALQSHRSSGDHRRYSRRQLKLTTRMRALFATKECPSTPPHVSWACKTNSTLHTPASTHSKQPGAPPEPIRSRPPRTRPKANHKVRHGTHCKALGAPHETRSIQQIERGSHRPGRVSEHMWVPLAIPIAIFLLTIVMQHFEAAVLGRSHHPRTGRASRDR